MANNFYHLTLKELDKNIRFILMIKKIQISIKISSSF